MSGSALKRFLVIGVVGAAGLLTAFSYISPEPTKDIPPKVRSVSAAITQSEAAATADLDKAGEILRGPRLVRGKAVEAANAMIALSGGSQDDPNSGAATLINLGGHLCASISDVQPVDADGAIFEVTCVEYRAGAGSAHYRLNGDTGDVSRVG